MPADENDPYDELPQDPELAFLALEEFYRKELDEKLRRADDRSDTTYFHVEYINQTVAAARALDLSILANWEVPSSDAGRFWATVQEFGTEIQNYRVQIKIHNARRRQGYSVAFDAVTKAKIRHHLTQVTEIINRLDIEQRKREALHHRVDALLGEVDRTRTRFDVFGAWVIEVAGLAGDAAVKLKPVGDLVGRLFDHAKKDEEALYGLPVPHDRKRLSAPPPKHPTPPELDDEIPF